MSRGPRTTVVGLGAVLALGLSACGGSDSGSDSGAAGGSPRTLTVLAASSLTETYGTLAKDFEKANPGVTVRLVLDSSATLAEMARQQAPGDVLATADQKTMDGAVADGGTRGKGTRFATNTLVVVAPADNPAGITAFGDLDSPQVDYVSCVPTAPCGAAAATLSTSEGLTHPPVSEEVDVKAVLAKVVADEADAGLVYRTDAVAAGKTVRSFPVPGAGESPNTYWVATTKGASDPTLAKSWVDLVTGPQGRSVLERAGFGPP